MAAFEKLYRRLPICLQNVACSAEGWRINRRRYTTDFMRMLWEYEARTPWPREQLVALRDQRLLAFVRHALTTTPHYQRWLAAEGGRVEDFKTADDLQRLPVLGKAAVKARPDDFLSRGVDHRGLHWAATSGTTGTSLRAAKTPEAEREQWAVWWRYRRWHGIDLDTWCGYLGGRSVVPIGQARPPFWRVNRPGRQIFYSAYHMNQASMGAYVDDLNRRRPPWLHGYPSLLSLLAAWMIEHNRRLDYRLRWITIGSENLMENQIEIISRAFDVQPLQHYGMMEGVANVSQCPAGRLHVDEEFAFMEWLPNPDMPGVFRVVGTNMHNPAFPLLRYEVGDVLTPDDGSCDCGRAGRLIQSIDGRQDDYIVLSNGTRLGRLGYIFRNATRIREAQIHQRRIGQITIRIVRGEGYTEADEQALLRSSRQWLGDREQITCEYVDALPRTRSGKLRLVVSELDQGRMSQVIGSGGPASPSPAARS